MTYKKVEIITNTEGSEIVAAILEDVCKDGVVIEDSRDYVQAVKSSIYENPEADLTVREDVKVTAYIDQSEAEEAIAYINDSLSRLDKAAFGKLSVNVSDYLELDYSSLWKTFHKPIEFRKIIIVPEWMEIESNKKMLRINIGSSFGTGQHISTVLAIEFLEKLDLEGKTVSDLGCGSGILGLSALLLGAKSAYLCDIEPVNEARDNARMNNLHRRCVIESKDLMLCNANADIVISNIYAPVLSEHRDKIISLVNKGGTLILSGLYKEGVDTVKKAYKDLQLIEIESSEDWHSAMFRKWN